MKFLLTIDPRTGARDPLFPVYVSEHPTAKEAVAEAIKRFGVLELDRCQIRVVGGEWPDQRLPIKICAVCSTPYAGFGRICPDRYHSKSSILEAYGAMDEDDI